MRGWHRWSWRWKGDGETVARVEVIVATDTPELLAMMHGETDIPKELRPWLDR